MLLLSLQNERVLFHYNGHGVPRPTANGEIWVFNIRYTQYIPLSIYELHSWVGSPCIYVLDCSAAGLLIGAFKQVMDQSAGDANRPAAGAAWERLGRGSTALASMPYLRLVAVLRHLSGLTELRSLNCGGCQRIEGAGLQQVLQSLRFRGIMATAKEWGEGEAGAGWRASKASLAIATVPAILWVIDSRLHLPLPKPNRQYLFLAIN